MRRFPLCSFRALCRALAVLCVGAASTLPAQSTAGSSIVIGSLIDQQGAPIGGAEIRLFGVNLVVTSAPDGTFSFGRVKAGKYQMMFRKIGFTGEMAEVDVLGSDTTSVAMQLERIITQLGTVTVVDSGAKGKAAANGFNERKLSGIAPQRQFVTAADIDRLKPVRMVDLLNRMSDRARACMNGTIYLDGLQLSNNGVALLNSLQPSEIEGVEVYAGPGQIPARFNATASNGRPPGCIVVIWTK
jgi:hypothetical protein